jgi:hypothetical protein
LTQVQEIQAGLEALFVGKDKRLSVIAALSIAATSAHMIGMSKIELQKILIRLYDKRISEGAGTSGQRRKENVEVVDIPEVPK